jgi:hypothetical protein
MNDGHVKCIACGRSVGADPNLSPRRFLPRGQNPAEWVANVCGRERCIEKLWPIPEPDADELRLKSQRRPAPEDFPRKSAGKRAPLSAERRAKLVAGLAKYRAAKTVPIA